MLYIWNEIRTIEHTSECCSSHGTGVTVIEDHARGILGFPPHQVWSAYWGDGRS